MIEQTRILVVEDLESDFELAQLEIGRSVEECIFKRVETREDFLNALKIFQPDVVLSDFSLPHFDGMTALKLAKEHAPLTPFIIWTGSMSEDIAVDCMRAGAHNYILKENLKRLGPAILHSIHERQLLLERRQAEQKLRESEERFRSLIENSLDNISLLAADGTLIWENPGVNRTLGYEQNEFVNRNIFELMNPDDMVWTKELFSTLVREPGSQQHGAFRLKHQDGAWRWIEATATNMLDNPSVKAIVINYHDVTERKQTEIKIQQRNDELQFINAINEAVIRGENFDNIVNLLGSEMKRIFSAIGSTIYILSPDKQSITMQQYYMDSRLARKIEQVIGSTIPLVHIPIREGTYFQKAIRSKEGFITSDAEEIKKWLAEFTETTFLPPAARRIIRAFVPQIYKLLNINSIVVVPLISEGQTIGLLDVSSFNLFTMDDLKRIENIGRQLSIAIHHKRANEKIHRSEEFLQSVQNALSASIAILNEEGEVVRVNAAWRKFGEQNGLKHPEDCIGLNYLDICDSTTGAEAEVASLTARSIREVIAGKRQEIQVEYPCHSPEENRWYILRITKFDDGEHIWVVLAHENITERKQAEEALRHAEKQLELFFSQSLDGFFFMMLDEPVRWDDTVDKEKTLDHVFEHQYVTRINKAMLDQYRAREEQFIGKTPTDFFAHNTEQGRQVWSQLFNEGHLHIETDERRFDDTQMWIEGDYICLYDDDGRIMGHFGVQRDVTDRKQAEKAVRDLARFPEENPSPILRTSKEGRIMYVNASGADWLKSWNITIGDILPDEWKKLVVETYEKDTRKTFDFTIQGRTYSTLIVPIQESGYVNLYGRDITEGKEAEEKLRESERRFHALFEDMPVAVWEDDLSEVKKYLDSLKEQGVKNIHEYFKLHPEELPRSRQLVRILDVNKAAIEMYGAETKQELIDITLAEMGPGELGYWINDLTAIANGMASYGWEGGDLKMDDTPMEISLSWSVVPGYEQDYSRVIFTTVDITERKRTESAEREQRNLAESLRDTAETLNSTLEYGDVLDHILVAAGRVVPHDAATILLIDGESAQVVRSHGYEKLGTNDEIMGIRLPLAETNNLRQMLETRQPVIVYDTHSYTGWTRIPITDWLRSSVGAPISISEEIIGFILLDSGSIGFFTPVHAERLKAFANQAALAIRNARLLQQAQEEIVERKQVEEALRESERRYRALFEDSPIAIWEEDFSMVKATLEEIKGQGILDLDAHLSAHPELISICLELVKITGVNQAALKLYGAKNKSDLLGGLDITYPKGSLTSFKNELVAISNDELSYQGESTANSLQGDFLNVSVNWVVAPGSEQSYSKVLVSLVDITERKQAEKELSEEKEEAQKYLDTAGVMMLALDRDGNISLINQKGCEILGYSNDEIVGKNWINTFIPESIRNEMQDVFQKKIWEDVESSPYYENPVLTKAGEQRMIAWHNSLVRDKNGSIAISLSSGEDITERLRAEQELRASEERFRQLADNIQEVFWMTDTTTGEELYISPASQKIWGSSFENIAKNPNAFIEAILPEDQDHVLRTLDEQRSGKKTEMEYRIAHSDGSIRWIWDRAFPIFDDSGKVVRLAGIAADITERKQAQEQLRKLSRAVEQSASTIVITDLMGNIEYANPKFTETTGYTLDEAMGQNPRILKSDHTTPEEYAQLWKTITSGEEWHGEFMNRKRNGELFWEFATISPIFNERKEITHFVAVKEDITERKQVENALRQSENRLRQVIDLVPHFIFAKDIHGRFILANQAVANSYGTTADELTSKLDSDFAKSEAEVKHFRSADLEVINSGQSKFIPEERITDADGNIRYLSTTKIPFTFSGNPSPAILGVSIDITDRKKAEHESARHLAELEALYENGLAVGQLLNPREIGERVIATFARHLSWHHVTIRLIQPESDNLEMIAFNLPGLGEEEKFTMEQHFKSKVSKLGQGLSGWVAQTGEPLRTGNVNMHPQYVNTQAGIQSGLYMPLKIGERILGVISVESETSNAFTSQDERLLATLASQAAIAFENARLYQTNQQERERFSDLFENSPIATWLEDFSAVNAWMAGLRNQGVTNLKEYLEGNPEACKLGVSLIDILDVNHAAVLMNGAHDKDELLEKVHGLMMEDTPSPVLINEMELIWRGYTSFGFEMSSQKLDGTTITGIQRVYIPIANNEPDYGRVIVTSTDITDRMDFENRLRTSEVHYRELADSITDVFFELDQELRFSHWNKASEILTGFSAEHAIGKSMLDVFGEPGGLGRIERDLWDVREKHQPRTFETIIPLNNQSRTFEINAYPSTRGVAVVAKDVTERKRSESLMQKRFELMEFSAEHNLEKLMQKTLDEISEWTHSAIGFFQLMKEDQNTSSTQVWSTDIFANFHSSEVEVMHKPADQAGVWAEAVHQRRSIIHNDYSSLSRKKGLPEDHPPLVRELVVPIIRNERIVAVIGIGNKVQDYNRDDLEITERFADYAWDIIERKQMVNEIAEERNQLAKRVEERTSDLSRANSNLARALRVKDEFLANMSHELRTPLNAILGLSESLSEQTAGPLNEKQHKYLTTIGESGHHLLSLINDILDLAKIEAGQITLDINKVDVNSVSQASLRMIKQLALKKNLDVSVEVDEKVGLMWADERRLKQMMVNLLSNAVKFTPEGGKIGMQINGEQEDNKVIITVWDSGIGIKESDFERLFQPFVQLDSGLARESSGTGLGLALVAQMARLHGGSVNVQSDTGRGSRFTITLPWEPALAPDVVERMKVTGKFRAIRPGQSQKTILLIEDTQEVVMMIKDYLEIAGYNVATAQDGIDGIAQAKFHHPDLILMDIQMPRMDGLEATKKLRQDREFKYTPIIALTALAMPNDRERCIAAGMDEYISKPVNLRGLVKLIQNYLSFGEEKTQPR